MILLIYLIFNIIILVNSIVIKNESEFRNIISNNAKEIIIDIESDISISSELKIDNNIEKLIILGKSTDSSSIIFKDLTQHLLFSKNIKHIELHNISIIGNVFFDNNKRILIYSVSLKGTVDSNYDEIENDYIKISNFYYKTTSYVVGSCINLSGNVEIDNSQFWGGSSCQRIFQHEGYDKYTILIKNSYFSGEYNSSCLKIKNELQSYVMDSFFEKGYCKPYTDGGYILILNLNNFFKTNFL